MKIKRSFTGILFISLALTAYLMFNCEGPMGPQGPPGPEGPQGPAGADAQTSAELIYVSYNDWGEYPAENMISAVMESSIITEDIAINGIVSVYYGTPGVEEWQPLPYTFVEENILETYWYYPGYVEIDRYGDTTVPGIPNDTLVYKVSAISK
jgi:hypothetical protein